MRLRSLQLVSFGPFRDKELRFDGDGIEVVFGPNEAGKSTTRRAVIGLFYGIPERSKDGHTHGEMSIAATLEDDAGKTIEVVRTKGRKTTLRTPKNEPIDEQVMTKLLGGMDLATYELACGLDHDLLRRGGAALRVGNGELGETLFAAATGLSGLHHVKTKLADEADALLGRGASKRPLNEATKAFAEAKKLAGALATSADKWEEQRTRIATARAELDALRREQTDKNDERARGRAIAKATRDLEAGRAKLRDLEEALAATRAALGAIEPKHALLAHAQAIEKLKASLGVHRKAAADRPKIVADLDVTEEKARRARQAAPESAVSRLPAAGHVRKLAEEGTMLRERGRAHELRAAETEVALERARARLGETADARDPIELREAIDAARREGNIEARVREARQTAEREIAAANAKLAALGADVTLEGVTSLPVPPRDAIASHARTFARTKDERRGNALRRHELDDERAEIDRAIASLRAEGDLPSDDELSRARADRDALWRDVKDGKPKPLVIASYERAVRGADDVADRLRREAARVTRLRELEAAREEKTRKLDGLAARELALAEETSAEERSWRALWTGVPVEARDPDQMTAWLSRWEAAAAASQRVMDARAAATPLEEMLEAARAALASALVKEGETFEKDAALPRLEQLGKRVLRAREEAAAARGKQNAEHAAAERDRDRAASDRAIFKHDLTGWSAQWAACTLALGLPESASPEQVTGALEAIGLLAHIEDEAEKTRRRIAGIDRDAASFAADVRGLCEACAPDLRERPADEAAAELSERIGRAREDDARRKTLAEHERKQDAQAREARAAVEKQTTELGSDVAVDPAMAEARVAQLDTDIGELDARIQQTKYDLGGYEAGAKQFDQSRAVDFAAEAQRQLAKVRDLAEQYARARLAAAAVTRLLERYRRENQGPVLARASELFSVLTLGSYEGLEVGFDQGDEPVLVALREKKQLEASALSDGTLDQLYLALRIASLERLVESRGPLPLLLDDVLVHFDDQRAAAALSVLGDLAKKTQVILFTHHRRVVDLATRAISDRANVRDRATAARVHELSP
jgi:uncharacterized protein YhaN